VRVNILAGGFDVEVFLEDVSSILLHLPVSPAAKQASEEKKELGDTPKPPARGRAPCNPASDAPLVALLLSSIRSGVLGDFAGPSVACGNHLAHADGEQSE